MKVELWRKLWWRVVGGGVVGIKRECVLVGCIQRMDDRSQSLDWSSGECLSEERKTWGRRPRGYLLYRREITPAVARSGNNWATWAAERGRCSLPVPSAAGAGHGQGRRAGAQQRTPKQARPVVGWRPTWASAGTTPCRTTWATHAPPCPAASPLRAGLPPV